MKELKNCFSIISLFCVLTIIGLTPMATTAAGFGSNLDNSAGRVLDKIYGTNYINSSGTWDATAATQKLPGVLGIVAMLITIVLGLVGLIFLILTIYGGVLWMSAQGNEEQVTKAQKIIKDSVIGLAIVIFAYLITYTIVARFIDVAGGPGSIGS